MAKSKQEILQAAGECFHKYGYSKTTMSDIGRMVGLKKASLYYYYKDKLSMYQDVVMYYHDQFISRVDQELELCTSIDDAILKFLEYELEFSEKNSMMVAVDAQDQNGVKSETHHVYQEVIEKDVYRLSKLIESGVAKGLYKEVDALRIASTIMTLARALLDYDCPMFFKEDEKAMVYNRVKEELIYTVTIILNGLK